ARQTWVARLGEQLRFDTQKQGGWFELLAQAGDLGEEELRVLNRHGDFLRAGVENTALNKSFKLILLLALLELDGLREPPTLAALAS
ncbi:DEAD/DEAH box helicase family protein, partial [Aeromonas media]